MQLGCLAALGRQSSLTSSSKTGVQIGTTCFTSTPRLGIFVSSSTRGVLSSLGGFLLVLRSRFVGPTTNQTVGSSTENTWTPIVGMEPTFFQDISVAMQLLAFSSPQGSRGSARSWSRRSSFRGASPGENENGLHCHSNEETWSCVSFGYVQGSFGKCSFRSCRFNAPCYWHRVDDSRGQREETATQA